MRRSVVRNMQVQARLNTLPNDQSLRMLYAGMHCSVCPGREPRDVVEQPRVRGDGTRLAGRGETDAIPSSDMSCRMLRES